MSAAQRAAQAALAHATWSVEYVHSRGQGVEFCQLPVPAHEVRGLDANGGLGLLQAVSDAANTHEKLRIGGVLLDLLAQPSHGVVHGAGARPLRVAQRLDLQDLPGDGRGGGLGQVAQQGHLGLGKGRTLVAPNGFAGVEVYHGLSKHQLHEACSAGIVTACADGLGTRR